MRLAADAGRAGRRRNHPVPAGLGGGEPPEGLLFLNLARRFVPAEDARLRPVDVWVCGPHDLDLGKAVPRWAKPANPWGVSSFERRPPPHLAPIGRQGFCLPKCRAAGPSSSKFPTRARDLSSGSPVSPAREAARWFRPGYRAHRLGLRVSVFLSRAGVAELVSVNGARPFRSDASPPTAERLGRIEASGVHQAPGGLPAPLPIPEVASGPGTWLPPCGVELGPSPPFCTKPLSGGGLRSRPVESLIEPFLSWGVGRPSHRPPI